MRRALAATVVATLGIACGALAQERVAYRGPEVEVTATRFRDRLDDRPVNVTVITSDDIARSTARTLPELLGEQAGINVTDLFGNNAAGAAVDLRGFGTSATQNTLILLDGRRITDIDISGVQWSAIPLAAIERVEIVRSGGGVLYGDGASGGVINIVTRSPAAGAPPASLALRGGSYSTYEGQIAGSYTGERFGTSYAASRFVSGGWRDNNSNRQSTGYADLRWALDGGEVSLKVLGTGQDLRLPGARRVQPSAGVNLVATDPRGTATPLDWSTRDQGQAYLDWRQTASWGEFVVGAGYRDKRQTSYYDFGGFPDYRVADLGVASFTPRARISHGFGPAEGTLVVGLDYYRWDYSLRRSVDPAAAGTPINSVSATQTNAAAYFYDTIRFAGGTTVAAGARAEFFRLNASDVYDPGAPGAFFGAAAPPESQRRWVSAWELGVRHPLAETVAAIAKAGQSFRFANVDEIYEFSPAFTPEFQPLEPQINRFAELGLDARAGATRARATVFVIDTRDEIYLDVFTTGIGNTNLPRTRRRGFELDTATTVGPVALGLAYTWLDARFREGSLPGSAFTAQNIAVAGQRVPLVPQNRVSARAAWTVAPGTQLAAVGTYASSQVMDNDPGNTFFARIPAYGTVDLKLTHAAGPWRVSATVANLLDNRYYTYAVASAFVPDRYNAYPLPGRTAWVALEYALK